MEGLEAASFSKTRVPEARSVHAGPQGHGLAKALHSPPLKLFSSFPVHRVQPYPLPPPAGLEPAIFGLEVRRLVH